MEVVPAIIESDALEFVLVAHLFKTLVKYKGCVAEAAKQLSINRRTVQLKCRKYGIIIDVFTREVFWPYTERLRIA